MLGLKVGFRGNSDIDVVAAYVGDQWTVLQRSIVTTTALASSSLHQKRRRHEKLSDTVCM